MALSKQTKANRRAFAKKYSRRTAAIIRLFAQKQRDNWGCRQIADRLDITSHRTVATTLGNLTRGAYQPFADIDVDRGTNKLVGSCQY